MDSFASIEIWLPIAAAFVPLLTALAVKSSATSTVRAAVAGAASVALAVIHELTEAPDFTVSGLVVVALTALVVQVGTYIAAWKPFADVNEKVAPTVGLS